MRYFAAIALALSLSPSFAADLNGYTAKYECRDGNANCDVDVAALANRPCDQVITPSMPWSSINWSNNTICIEAGDHTSKGMLTFSASGTATNRKVLRYYRVNDNNDVPWNQNDANKAKITAINVNSNDYWVIHRLALVGTGSGYEQLQFRNSANNNIVDRVLSEGSNLEWVIEDSSNVTIQNSVLRNSGKTFNTSVIGISMGGAIDAHIVNNEIYDIAGHSMQFWENGQSSDGAVIENNDIYTSNNQFTDCNGNYTPNDPNSKCTVAEMSISLKNNGTQAKPIQIIHNRLWGSRRTDVSLCCDGGGEGGGLISVRAGAASGGNWIMIRNNILMESQVGVGYYPAGSTRTSLIGNLAYKIKRYHPSFDTGALLMGYSDRAELYLNTIIDSDIWTNLNATNGDIRCNVALSSGGAVSTPGSGTQVEFNSFYQTPSYSNGNPVNTVSRATTAESRNTNFCFNRKLLTGPELVCIPNVRPTTTSPHYKSCDPGLGSRTAIGIDDNRM